MTSIRVLVVDDHPIYRDGLRAALRTGDIDVVGEATTATEAVASVEQLKPDVVLMDVGLPGGGLEATREVVATQPHTKVLMLTMSEDQRTLSAAVQAGATGYLVKGVERDELIDAIRAVASGTLVFAAAVARPVLDSVAKPRIAFPELTDREREVLELMADGLTNTAIGQRLFLSPKTVRNYVSNIIGKLGVDDREAAAALVRRTS